MDQHYIRNTLASYIPEIDDSNIIGTIFPDKALPGVLTLDFDQHYTFPSEIFFARMKDLRSTHMLAIPSSVIPFLCRHDRVSQDELYKPIPMDNIEKEMVAFAIQFIQDMGYSEEDILQYPISKVKLGNDIHGLADRVYRRIYIAPDAFTFGKKYVASTVFEEFLHLERGFADCTRELQGHLFETIISLMEKYYYRRAI